MPPKAKAGGRSKSKGGKKHPPLEIKSRIQDPDRELYFLICNRGSNESIRQLFMIHKPDVNMKYQIDRFTPLLRAAQRGEARLVELLLDLKADPNYKDIPQLPGTSEGSLDPKAKGKAKAAPKKAAPKAKSSPGGKGKPSQGDPAQGARDRCPPVPMEPICDGGTALHLAVQLGSLPVVNALLNCKDTDPNILDKKGRTPLMIACSEGRERTTQRLLGHPSVNVEKKDSLGRTILMSAALRGQISICKLLLANENTKRLLDEKDPRGRTAVDIVLAQSCSPQGPEVIDMLRAARPGMSVSNEDLQRYVLREGAVRLLPGGRVIREEAADENGETELFRITRMIMTNESARGARQAEVAEAFLREMPISAIMRVNNSQQTVLHVGCGALPVPKKKVEEKHEEFHRQGVVGTDRHVMDELKAMMKTDLDQDKSAEETFQEGLVLSTIDNDCCRRENITVLAVAEGRARRRLHRRLVAAILNAAPDELRDRKDDRGMRAMDYARIFGDDEIQRMLKSPTPVRPRSPSAKDDLSTFYHPKLASVPSSGSLDPKDGGLLSAAPPTASGRRLSSPSNRGQLMRPQSAMSVSSFTSTAQASDGQVREGDAREGWGETSTAPSTRPQTPMTYSRKGGDPEKESKVS